MIPGKYCLEGCRKINEKRLSASKYDNLEATKKRREIRRGKAKTKDDKKQVHSKTQKIGFTVKYVVFYCHEC